ncbi:hypothetical protein BH09BAC3_BH09BAC3_10940 [soil metagenome]
MRYVYNVKTIPTEEKTTILCIVDFSQSSNDTLNWAISIARKLRGHLCILFVYRLVPSRSGELIHWKKTIEEEAQLKFLAIEQIELSKSGLSYEFKIEIGFIADRIENFASKNDLVFIVMDKNAYVDSTESFDDLMKLMKVPLLLCP